jgi:hypothetical protein
MFAHRFIWQERGGRDALLAFDILAEHVEFKQRRAAYDAQLDAFERLGGPRTWWRAARDCVQRRVVGGRP